MVKLVEASIIDHVIDYVGQVVGEIYHVDRCLGTGRFASVYSGKHIPENRPVALKIFKPHIAGKAGGRRFLGQTKMASKPPHPAIAALQDRGETDDGIPFVVMELLQGRTLQQEVEDKGPLALVRCLHIATELLEAIDAVHQGGNTHRSLNPNNVFLCAAGSSEHPVRILDYGVAKDLVDYLAVSPDVIGQTRYMAPEFLLNRNMIWTPAIDVFAAGLVGFFMLTGRLPFEPNASKCGDALDAPTLNIYHALNGEHPGPADFSPRVPKVLDEVVRKAISIKQAGRYSDAGEMLAAFREARAQIDLSKDSKAAPWQKPKIATPPASKPLPRFLKPLAKAETPNRAVSGTSAHQRQQPAPQQQQDIDPFSVPPKLFTGDQLDEPTMPLTSGQLLRFQSHLPQQSTTHPPEFPIFPAGADEFLNLFDTAQTDGVHAPAIGTDKDDIDQATSMMSTLDINHIIKQGQLDSAAKTAIDEVLEADTYRFDGIDLFSYPEKGSQLKAEEVLTESSEFQDDLPTDLFESMEMTDQPPVTSLSFPMSFGSDEPEDDHASTRQWKGTGHFTPNPSPLDSLDAPTNPFYKNDNSKSTIPRNDPSANIPSTPRMSQRPTTATVPIQPYGQDIKQTLPPGPTWGAQNPENTLVLNPTSGQPWRSPSPRSSGLDPIRTIPNEIPERKAAQSFRYQQTMDLHLPSHGKPVSTPPQPSHQKQTHIRHNQTPPKPTISLPPEKPQPIASQFQRLSKSLRPDPQEPVPVTQETPPRQDRNLLLFVLVILFLLLLQVLGLLVWLLVMSY